MNLRSRIADEIAERGPMPFERFMDLALYGPGGFFATKTLRSARSGDFLTSPEVSRLFGETLGGFTRNEHERLGEPFQVIEVGAGSGSLLAPLLEVHPVDGLAIEVSPAARAALDERGILTALALPDEIRGVVIANELLDNLPMAVAQRIGPSWRERFVGLDDGSLVFVDGDPRPDIRDWLDRYAGDVPDGGWVEVQMAAQSWLSRVLDLIVAGAVMVIDYGDTAEGLLPRRSDGTLRTYRSHHLGPHPLDEPGATDITADVNFTALLDTARRAGAHAELHRQDDFLSQLGLRERLRQLREEELDAARDGDSTRRLQLRTAKTEAETLLHPRGLGDFRVMVCRVDGEPELGTPSSKG